ncbi:MAG: transglycosylase domain-containing protein [Thermoflexales bacterium]|nr:transglycosylase domain-containing protein [Thermoflexales bacterium]
MRSTNLIRLRQRRRERARNGGLQRLLRAFAILAVIVTAIAVATPVAVGVAASAVYNAMTSNLPDPTKIQTVEQDFQTTKIFDRNAKLLYEVIDEQAGDRQWVTLDAISPYLRCAVVASEDRRYYETEGIDLRGLARAVVNNLQNNATQGASGIIQQLVKNTITPPEERLGEKRTTSVKIRETLVAMEVSRRYDKKTLLEWYLNTNFYGNLAYGIEAASRVYFGKSARDLTLAESAALAPIPQFPTQNPFDKPNEAKVRQGIILQAMLEGTEAGVKDCNVTPQQVEEARLASLKLRTRQSRFNIQAPHFSVYARDHVADVLADHLGITQAAAVDLVNRGGLKIYTTLDLDMNEQVQKLAVKQVTALAEAGKKANNAAIVVLKRDTAEILAMVGSVDYYNDTIDGKYNVALALRQPGSSFKPITYLELLRQGKSAATMFWDVRTTFPSGGDIPYTPENYDRKYHGPIRMRQALSRSYNIPAVDALNQAGIGNVIRTAHKLGITDLDKGLEFYGLALTLGGGEVKLLDLTYVYDTFANGGTMVGAARPAADKKSGYRELDPVSILRVEDAKGKVLFEHRSAQKPDLLGPNSKQLTYVLADMLSDPNARAAAFGDKLDLEGKRTAAVKTGTTNDNKDNWTMGFTTDFVVGVWVGNTDNTPMDSSVTGLTGAAPIWIDVMNAIHKGRPNQKFTRPDGLVDRAICQIDGLVPNGICPGALEVFVKGTEPTQTSRVVQKFPINKETGKLAGPGTPADKVEERVMYVFPPQAADWIGGWTEDEKKLYPLAPFEFDAQAGGTIAQGDVAIGSPGDGSYVSPLLQNGPIEIRGNAKGGNWVGYKVFFAPGFSPAPDKFQQIGPDHGEQVDNNVLERLDLGALPNGPYTLKLTRIEQDGRSQDALARFTVDAISPTIKLIQPLAGEQFQAPKDEWVDVGASVSDNVAIDRVEFFVNNGEKPFLTKSVAPYNVKWTVPPGFSGVAELYAVAYDKAGNRTTSQKVRVFVTYKKP